MFCSQEALIENPVLETGFTPSEIQELSSLFNFQSPQDSPNSGLEWSNSNSNNSNSNSNSNPNPNRAIYSVDERKRRRMISNRKSAQRSRWRKKMHLEKLSGQLTQLEIQNRELKNQLGSIFERCFALWRENNRLTTEHLSLQTRLSTLSHVLVAMQSMDTQQQHTI